MKTEGAESAEAAARAAVGETAPDGARRVFDDGHVAEGRGDLVRAGRVSELIDHDGGDGRVGARGGVSVSPGVPLSRVDVDEAHLRAQDRDSVRRARPGQRRDEDLLTGRDPERLERHDQRGGSARDRDGVPTLAALGHHGLEAGDLGALDEHPGAQHGGDGVELGVSQQRPGEGDHLAGVRHPLGIADPGD